MDCAFLAVTLVDGTVKLFKMPPIINPFPAGDAGSSAHNDSINTPPVDTKPAAKGAKPAPGGVKDAGATG